MVATIKRWQLVVLLLIGSVLIVKCGHHEKSSKHEEDGGHEEKEDHFHDESHKGDKGHHKKVRSLELCSVFSVIVRKKKLSFVHKTAKKHMFLN